MKPLSELVKEWREYAKLTAACGSVTSGISAESLIRCAEELQAWLREADDYLQGWGKRRFMGIGKPLKTPFSKGDHSSVKMVLQMVLGTTQKPKQEEEKR